MSDTTMAPAVCRLTPAATDCEFIEPGVYVCLLPEEGKHDDSEDVVSFLVTEPTRKVALLRAIGGLEEAEGVYPRVFKSFGDMAKTLQQGVEALYGGEDE